MNRQKISAFAPDDEARFWSKVDKRSPSECWLWLAALTPGGYGRFSLRGTLLTASRVAYKLSHGAVPDELDVLHSCDVRACCNPAHLRVGTAADNARDREGRNRHRHPGRPKAWRKLAPDTVRLIRSQAQLYSTREHARRHNLSYDAMRKVLNFITYKEVV